MMEITLYQVDAFLTTYLKNPAAVCPLTPG